MRTLAVGYPAGHRLPVHQHDYGQLAYAASGFLTLHAEASSWVVPADRAAWIPAGTRHALATRVRTRLHTIYLPLGAAPGLGDDTTVFQVTPLVRELIAAVVGRGTLDLTAPADRRLVDVLVDQARLIDVAPLDLRSPVDARAREASDLLRDDPSRDPSEVARAVGSSRRTLERRFREETALALGRWRQRAQVLRAMELLAEGASVTDAGRDVGYATTSAFIAAFRRVTGATPGRFVERGRPGVRLSAGDQYASRTMWLPWKAALALACALAIVPFLVVIGLFARPKRRGPRFAMSFARETAVVLGLYALWQYAGTLALLHVDGAINRGYWIYDFQERVHLPDELTVQQLVMHSSLLTQALNVFYATMHFPGMIAFLIWMFVRHRDRYPQVRNTMVLVTGAALAIQLVPVAPPRLTPGLGFVDTGALYHQSVYAKVGTPGPDQLSAMPSVHVAWALLVALGVVVFSTSKWRWFIIAHPFMTILAVVATANHWWLDGIVAAQLIGVAIVVERVMHAALVKLGSRAPLPRPIAIPSEPAWDPPSSGT